MYRTHAHTLYGVLCYLLVAFPAEGVPRRAEGPLSGAWSLQATAKEYLPSVSKPVVGKVKVTFVLTDAAAGPVSDLTVSSPEDERQTVLQGKRYGTRFFARYDSPIQSIFMVGSCTIEKKSGIATAIRGTMHWLDGESIAEARFTAKRAPL